jgi:hypothetical protein
MLLFYSSIHLKVFGEVWVVFLEKLVHVISHWCNGRNQIMQFWRLWVVKVIELANSISPFLSYNLKILISYDFLAHHQGSDLVKPCALGVLLIAKTHTNVQKNWFERMHKKSYL